MKLQLAVSGLYLSCELRRDEDFFRNLRWLADPERARLHRRLWRRFSRAVSLAQRTAS